MREDWIEFTLEEVKKDSLIGLVRSSGDQNNKSVGTPYLKMNNIDMIGNLQLSNLVFVDVSDDEIEKYSLKFGDILINTRNSYELVGKTGTVRSLTGNVVFNNNIMRLRVKEGFDNFFIGYQLISPFIRKQMEKHKKATTSVCALYQRDLFPLILKIPHLSEQRAIVAKIEELFSSLDSGIADLKKAQDKLKIYRQAVLKKAFEGGLTKEWRTKQTNLPTADELLEQIKEERQNHYKQQIEDWKKAVEDWEKNGKEFSRPGKPKKISDFITDYEEKTLVIPTTWREGVLECIADAVDPQPSHRTPPKVDGGVPFVSIADIDKITGEINFEDARSVGNNVLVEHINRYKLRKGDFVIGKIGTIGKPFFIPTERFFTLSANVVLVQPFERTCSPKFLFYFNISPQIEQQFTKGAKATTQAAFGIQKVRLLRVPLCAIEEQNQIVQEIESRLSVCDKVEESIIESLEKSKALRQSILKKAFEGRLLNDQELAACKSAPDYEPASVLLERIKAEKNNKK